MSEVKCGAEAGIVNVAVKSSGFISRQKQVVGRARISK